MPPVYVLVLAAWFGGIYYVGDKAVQGVKQIDTLVVHQVKHVGNGIVHVVKKVL